MKKILSISLALVSTVMMAQVNPYINKVYEYVPAPGQFVNANYPTYNQGETAAEILARVDSTLAKAPNNVPNDLSGLICLGAWGGYVTFGFDHAIVNQPGVNDLRIYGNAFYTGVSDDGLLTYGSPEPGIIYVSQDTNGDGLPNDTWYEIAGSESEHAIRNYQVTYHRSNGDIAWEDNMGGSGVVSRNSFHAQESYYPMWLEADSYTLSGSLLPSNYVEVTKGGYTSNRTVMYDYGYADNWPNDYEQSAINLDWAIDAEGQPANLTHIHFVRVQTGIQLDIKPSGEQSTEIAGACDLHPELSPATGFESIHANTILSCKEAKVYDLMGRLMFSAHSVSNVPVASLCATLPRGIYVIVADNQQIKYLKQ